MKKEPSNGISRRRLLAMAGLSAGATLLTRHPVFADEDRLSTIASTAANAKDKSFGSLKQIDAGLLNVGYAEAGPLNGPPVILLHGWPYDIHSFVDVAPVLAAKGYRVVVPHLRGYGSTRFLSREFSRMASRRQLLSTSSR